MAADGLAWSIPTCICPKPMAATSCMDGQRDSCDESTAGTRATNRYGASHDDSVRIDTGLEMAVHASASLLSPARRPVKCPFCLSASGAMMKRVWPGDLRETNWLSFDRRQALRTVALPTLTYRSSLLTRCSSHRQPGEMRITAPRSEVGDSCVSEALYEVIHHKNGVRCRGAANSARPWDSPDPCVLRVSIGRCHIFRIGKPMSRTTDAM